MLSRRYRLKKTDNVGRILKQGKKLESRHLIIRFFKNSQTHHRFGVIVSSKIHAKATDRNRLRRQIYEATRINYERFPSRDYFDIIILGKKSSTRASYSDLETSLISMTPDRQ
ncbi:MAG: hypothetical protein ACD_28C00327G0004 [uncultured bacterium]|nr:MAG: hypothetical protein ACD_28C00327G0004 [uncultured bacterium]KKT75462.1 MAG: Ribonuclease P protein component [Candidatus Peregrinibacteria bacterium GW2011_GWA2_44_7]